MRASKYWLVAGMALLIAACSGSGQPEAADGPSQASRSTLLPLHLSDDGTAIVDEQGNLIAQFVEGMNVKLQATTKSGGPGIPGCFCCTDECLAYDSNGKCVKTHRSCTWNFDCKCD